MAALRQRWPWFVFCGLFAGVVLAIGAHAAHILWHRNLNPVVPGMVYRSAQLSGQRLDEVICGHGIQTVLNLRGKCEHESWYQEECRSTARADICLEDVCLSAGRLPSTEELRYLVRVLDGTRYPILIHCQQGADRTGLAATLILLLYTNATPQQALRQLSVRYGHVRLGRTANMDEFFEQYLDWLEAQGQTHRPALLRRWLEHDYRPGTCSAKVEPLTTPREVAVGRPWLAQVRVTNTSVETWRLRPGKNVGVHLGFRISDGLGQVEATGRAGLFHADVPPGGHIDLQVALPGIERPGRYTVLIDMIDEQHSWFFQVGSPPLTWAVQVRGAEEQR